jgi:hypothetical protein
MQAKRWRGPFDCCVRTSSHALRAVLGERDLAAFQRRWERFVLGLSFPERKPKDGWWHHGDPLFVAQRARAGFGGASRSAAGDIPARQVLGDREWVLIVLRADNEACGRLELGDCARIELVGRAPTPRDPPPAPATAAPAPSDADSWSARAAAHATTVAVSKSAVAPRSREAMVNPVLLARDGHSDPRRPLPAR